MYYLFPGGGVEDGETDEMAAVRETREELGLQVEITRFLGTVTFGTATQIYFEVCTIRGEFGTGDGPEMSSPEESAHGSYEPVWFPIDELSEVDVRPVALASMLAAGSFPSSPFQIVET